MRSGAAAPAERHRAAARDRHVQPRPLGLPRQALPAFPAAALRRPARPAPLEMLAVALRLHFPGGQRALRIQPVRAVEGEVLEQHAVERHLHQRPGGQLRRAAAAAGRCARERPPRARRSGWGWPRSPCRPARTSCAVTSSVMPEMRLARWRCAARAPCADRSPWRCRARWRAIRPCCAESSATGESAGRLILIELCGSSGRFLRQQPGGRQRAAGPPAGTALLLRIYVIDRHVAGFRIHVASPHGPLRAHQDR